MNLPTHIRDHLNRLEPEKDFQAWVIEAATTLGWLAYHPFDSRRSTGGFPDLVLVKNGHLIFAELKKQTAAPRADQQMWLQALEGVPAVEVYVWRPADRDDILTLLKAVR